MRGDKQLRVAMMVRGYIPSPRPIDMVYAPIDLAVGIAQILTQAGHQIDYYAPTGGEIPNVTMVTRNLRPLATNNQEFQDLLARGEPTGHYLPNMWDTFLAQEMFRRAHAGEYDLLHFHHPEVALPLATLYKHIPVVYTLHDPIFPWYREMFELYDSPNQHFVSISNSQQRDAPDLRYAGTIYDGVDTDHYKPTTKHDDYLLFAGRIVPEKGIKEAIQVALATNHRLLIIGPVPPCSQGYFDQYIKPHLNEQILYLGFIERDKMLPYYQKAKALLVPIQWEEAFGLTTIEAMACGTPAIAIARGSMPEIIKDGQTGYLVKSIGEMIDAVHKINRLNRRACREHVMAHFSLRQMVDKYEAVYHDVLNARSPAAKIQTVLTKNVHKGITKTKNSVGKLRSK